MKLEELTCNEETGQESVQFLRKEDLESPHRL